MNGTPLLYKPVWYGSSLTNYLFLLILWLHILPALIAPVTAVVALATKKGSRLHIRAGKLFVFSMIGVALTGILLDAVRLLFFVSENHTKYAGFSIPSAYPARIAFLFAGFCVLYLLSEAKTPYVANAKAPRWREIYVPGALLLLGFCFSALIIARFNPWAGNLWMIWTFMWMLVLALRYREPTQRVVRHRVTMSLLGAFSWWGSLQGFGPAILIALSGADPSVTPYVGDQPGPMSMTFLFFLIGWGPPFIVALFLISYFAKRSA